ncbi:alpha/beta hydrolase [Variovorax sp. PCZ-1]|uniref:alpha/beta hydrolase n=1 Tax=Variovorax sp. PCZ-1 TaxID=2835533 RepID=UPI001BCC2CF6|nr:alpha/beta hydrolase [Variovorax sp. PCZ-1]MBS7807233.1 alpha/beta hydrolase [Variovorax sp. PCZ-1]
MSTALSPQDDPDGQIPMPFPAAAQYAAQVMTWAREADFSGLQVQRGLAYGAHRLQRMDVFAPQAAHHAPILIFWHGGGWTNGYREYVHFMAKHVCASGMILIAPSYRLVSTHKLPAAYEDALACLAHVHAHASEFGGNTQRILLSGHSAGGHLASLLALRKQSPAHSSIQACLPISAIMDLHHPAPPPDSLEERVYKLVLQNPLDDTLMSPLCWAAGNNIPFELFIGEHDSERVRLSNRRLHTLLKTQPAPAALHQHAGQSHFDTHTSLMQPNHPWYRQLAQHAFL